MYLTRYRVPNKIQRFFHFVYVLSCLCSYLSCLPSLLVEGYWFPQISSLMLSLLLCIICKWCSIVLMTKVAFSSPRGTKICEKKDKLSVWQTFFFKFCVESSTFSVQLCFVIQSMDIKPREKPMCLMPGLYYYWGTRCIGFSWGSISIDCIKHKNTPGGLANLKNKPWISTKMHACTHKLSLFWSPWDWNTPSNYHKWY